MAATTYGTAHLYGISGTIPNATVLSFKEKNTKANTDKTENEGGNVIETRNDDSTFEATITIKIRSGYTKPVAGTLLTYETIVYEITSVGRDQVNKGFRTVELEIRNSEYITYS